jgi:GGDEF domain-containing protein
MAGEAAAIRARVCISARLREAVRRDTLLAHVSDTGFLVAEVFTSPDPSPLAERLRSAVATAPYRLTASIGALITPLRALVDAPATAVIDELVAVATEQMADARRAGGHQIRVSHCPRLAVLTPSDGGDEPTA